MSFHVVTQESISNIIKDSHYALEDIVKSTYLSHEAGETINPDSYFLRFPKRPSARIIALPASISNENVSVSGIKWIASYPENIKLNKQRASAVLILNDIETGYPIACLESSLISAYRTAASATLGAYYLSEQERKANNIGVIGAGFIAKVIIDFLINTEWDFDSINLYDLENSYSNKLSDYIEKKYGRKATIHKSLEDACKVCDLIFLTTTSSEPYIKKESVFSHNPSVIHVSLRDISEDIIYKSFNIVDDIDHSLKANTSLHLAEQKYKNRTFVKGTIAGLVNKSIDLPDKNITRIFSPFGMGILDLSVGYYTLSQSIKKGTAIEIPNFINESQRY